MQHWWLKIPLEPDSWVWQHFPWPLQSAGAQWENAVTLFKLQRITASVFLKASGICSHWPVFSDSVTGHKPPHFISRLILTTAYMAVLLFPSFYGWYDRSSEWLGNFLRITEPGMGRPGDWVDSKAHVQSPGSMSLITGRQWGRDSNQSDNHTIWIPAQTLSLTATHRHGLYP